MANVMAVYGPLQQSTCRYHTYACGPTPHWPIEATRGAIRRDTKPSPTRGEGNRQGLAGKFESLFWLESRTAARAKLLARLNCDEFNDSLSKRTSCPDQE